MLYTQNNLLQQEEKIQIVLFSYFKLLLTWKDTCCDGDNEHMSVLIYGLHK